LDCYSQPENAHKKPGNESSEKTYSVTTSTPARYTFTCNYCQKIGNTEKQWYRRKMLREIK
jgi:hypothetical protein